MSRKSVKRKVHKVKQLALQTLQTLKTKQHG